MDFIFSLIFDFLANVFGDIISPSARKQLQIVLICFAAIVIPVALYIAFR